MRLSLIRGLSQSRGREPERGGACRGAGPPPSILPSALVPSLTLLVHVGIPKGKQKVVSAVLFISALVLLRAQCFVLAKMGNY